MIKGYVNLYSRDLSSKKWPNDVNFLIAFWGSVFLLVVFMVYYGFALTNYFKESKRNRELTSSFNALSLKDKELLSLSFKLKEMNVKSKAIESTIKDLNKLFQQKIYWVKFLEIFSKYLNDNVWIDTMSIDFFAKDTNYLYVQIKGGAITLKDLNKFVEKVENDNESVKISFKVIDKKGVIFYSFGLNFAFNTARLK